MNNSLDISIHGPQRVAIVERLVHICRYSPGLVLLEGDAGKSPVNFLRDMSNLLRDELDFALLDDAHCDMQGIAAELVSQWYIFQVAEHEQTDIQSVHHYLDLGLQSGRLALIVIERASSLADDAINFLVAMMARHSRLTILFAGIVDARPLLRRAQQAEVPAHRIDMPDSADHASFGMAQGNIPSPPRNLSASNFDHIFSDASYELPEDDEMGDELCESDALIAGQKGRREPVMSGQYTVTQSPVRLNASDTRLGVSTRLSAVQAWGAATLAEIRGKKSSGAPLVLGCMVLAALLLLLALYPRNTNVASVESASAPPILMIERLPASQPESPSSPPGIVSTPTNNSSVAAIKSDPVGAPAPSTPVVSSSTPQPQPPEIAIESSAQVVPEQPVRSLKPDKVNAVAPSTAAPVTEKQWRSKPDNFTIQVAAAHSEANIKRLGVRLPLSQPHFIFRTTRSGKPWFILIYGSFTGKPAATAARDALPAEIKKDSTPWLRKQGEVFAQ